MHADVAAGAQRDSRSAPLVVINASALDQWRTLALREMASCASILCGTLWRARDHPDVVMGGAKTEMMEADERGWSTDEKFVCDDCVEDEHLKQVIRSAANHDVCDYCGRKGTECAAPLENMVEAVADTLTYYFAEPTEAGVPRDDGEWLIEGASTQEALDDLGLDGQHDLIDDIVNSIYNDAWVEASGGHWASSHDHEVLRDSWLSFVHVVKHQSRFFFEHSKKTGLSDPQELEPASLLRAVESIISSCGLLMQIPASSTFFRVRERHRDEGWKPDNETMGPPPSERARAGRMNPPGISYFYSAMEKATAVAEVVRGPPSRVVAARFQSARELRVIDLTSLPNLPSIFDGAQRDLRESVLFLRSFVESISQPVRKDGQEHLDYVPSQVVCEYFALVIRAPKGRGIDGVLYPSAVRAGGKNLVLFPTDRSPDIRFDHIAFVSAEVIELDDWRSLTTAVS